MKPALIKEIAKKFIAVHYPKYSPEADEIWDVLVGIDIDNITNNEEIQRHLPEGLAFGGEADAEFQEMMRRVNIFNIVDRQINYLEGISKAALLERIKNICKALRINSDIDDKIRSIVDATFPSLSEEQEIGYARIWTETELDGKLIDEEGYHNLLAKKVKYDIFLIDKGEYNKRSVGEVYFNNIPVFLLPQKNKKASIRKSNKRQNKKFLTPLDYRILFHTLKNKCVAGDIPDIVENCWFDKKDADRLRKKLAESGNDDIYREKTAKYRTAIGKLSAFLMEHLNLTLRTSGHGKYQLSFIPKYILIMKSSSG